MPKELHINSKTTKPKGPAVFRMFLNKPLTQITRKDSMSSVNNEILSLGLTHLTMIKSASLYVRTCWQKISRFQKANFRISKAKSILYCINTVAANVFLLSELSLHYFQYFFSHVIFETTVLAFYWDTLRLLESFVYTYSQLHIFYC